MPAHAGARQLRQFSAFRYGPFGTFNTRHARIRRSIENQIAYRILSSTLNTAPDFPVASADPLLPNQRILKTPFGETGSIGGLEIKYHFLCIGEAQKHRRPLLAQEQTRRNKTQVDSYCQSPLEACRHRPWTVHHIKSTLHRQLLPARGSMSSFGSSRNCREGTYRSNEKCQSGYRGSAGNRG